MYIYKYVYAVFFYFIEKKIIYILLTTSVFIAKHEKLFYVGIWIFILSRITFINPWLCFKRKKGNFSYFILQRWNIFFYNIKKLFNILHYKSDFYDYFPSIRMSRIFPKSIRYYWLGWCMLKFLFRLKCCTDWSDQLLFKPDMGLVDKKIKMSIPIQHCDRIIFTIKNKKKPANLSCSWLKLVTWHDIEF